MVQPSGTTTDLAQCGHLIFFPTTSAFTLSFFWHSGQGNKSMGVDGGGAEVAAAF
jgi:hypothetical protein